MTSTQGKQIECKAIVAWAPNQPLKCETIAVEPPQSGEVRIKILSTSVCHTDLHTLGGTDSEAKFPCILGHEGAGCVESVGEGVTSVQVGDYVVPLYMTRCNECKFCCKPEATNLCDKILVGKCVLKEAANGEQQTSRFSCNGKPIYHYMGTSTFSEYTVVPEIAIAKIPNDFNLQWACLLGCGVATGYGAALNTAQVKRGDTVAIFGLGGVGLAAAMACKQVGCGRIIGVDIDDNKFELAKQFGVTEFVNPKKTNDKPVQQILVEMTDGGCDKTIECIGNVNTMQAAIEACAQGGGKAVVIGLAPMGQNITVNPFLLITGRNLLGSAYGDWKGRDDFPKLVEAATSGVLDVDKFISHKFNGIESVIEAAHLLKEGKALKSVVSVIAQPN